jgi:prophage regulatory protein
MNIILRLPAVKARTGLSRSTIYLRIAAGTFPAPVSLGARAVGWIESEIDAWLSTMVDRSRRQKTTKVLDPFAGRGGLDGTKAVMSGTIHEKRGLL